MRITPKSPLGSRLLQKGLVKPEDFTPVVVQASGLPEDRRKLRGLAQAERAKRSADVPVPEFPVSILPSRKRKWRNIPTRDSQGVLHPSRLQAHVTDRLRHESLAVVPEVSMPLSERPRDRIRIDALVIIRVMPDGTFIGKFIEVKGVDLGEGKQKRLRFEDRYKVPIEVIRK